MGLFDSITRLFRPSAKKLDEAQSHLAFVLLNEAAMPAADDILAAFEQFKGPAENLKTHDSDDPSDSDRADDDTSDILMLEIEGIGTAFVALMPAPIPEGEAESATQFSLSAVAGDWQMDQHHAHLIVSLMMIEDGVDSTTLLMAFTSLLAAVTKASNSVGVYWGNAGATHSPDFFLAIAAEHAISPRITLWNGMSMAHEPDGRTSLLSHGMSQLGLPDLYLIASPESHTGAIERFFDLLAYVADRAEPIPDGDTIGTTPEERIPIHYVKSPADRKETVWKVEI